MQMFSLTLDLNQAPCSGRGKAQALGARLAFSLSHCELWASTGGAGCAPTGLTSICPEHSPKLRWTFQFRATTGWLPGMRICWHKSSAGLILLSSYPLLTLWGRYNFRVREDQQKKVRMAWCMSTSAQTLPFAKDTENWPIQRLCLERHQCGVQQKPYTVHERQPFYCFLNLSVFTPYCFLGLYTGSHIS